MIQFDYIFFKGVETTNQLLLIQFDYIFFFRWVGSTTNYSKVFNDLKVFFVLVPCIGNSPIQVI